MEDEGLLNTLGLHGNCDKICRFEECADEIYLKCAPHVRHDYLFIF